MSAPSGPLVKFAAGPVAILLIGGCVGGLDPEVAAESPDSSMVSDAGTVPDPDGSVGVGAGAPLLRHLTRTQYAHAVSDMFGRDFPETAGLPGEDVSVGFAVGRQVSGTLAEKYFQVAESIAETVAADPGAFDCQAVAWDDDCVAGAISRLTRLAFRRTPTSDELAKLTAVFAAGERELGPQEGFALFVHGVLVSPQFLYFQVGLDEIPTMNEVDEALPALTDHELATRLAFLLWDSVPDEALLDAADAADLTDSARRASVAESMMNDPRARRGFRMFYSQWLGLSRLTTANKDAKLYPQFRQSVADTMRRSFEQQVDTAVWDDEASLADLLQMSGGFSNAQLAPIFGIEDTAAELHWVADVPQRQGVLSHPAIMTAFASMTSSDPVRRGKLIRERFLCDHLPAPPPDVEAALPEMSDAQTTRERYETHAHGDCAPCHSLMDPLGFAFEHYDAVGAYRADENGAVIDASGEVVEGGDADGAFDGSFELSQQLAASQEVSSCFADQLYRFALGQQLHDAQAFSETAVEGDSVRDVLFAIIDSDAFGYAQRVSP